MKKFAGNEETGYIEAQDSTCAVYCDCGNEVDLWVGDSVIERCKNCGKGYITEFVVWQYDKEENETEKIDD